MTSREQENCAADTQSTRSRQIRKLNDQLRIGMQGGQVFATNGICSLKKGMLATILAAVRSFDAFTPDNDPYGEHDFGALSVAGHRVCWKIDYFDNSMRMASPDPTDPAVTIRVLTIMLASEY